MLVQLEMQFDDARVHSFMTAAARSVLYVPQARARCDSPFEYKARYVKCVSMAFGPRHISDDAARS